MSLYADYVKERAGVDCVESDRGFMTFQIQGKECFIHDAYVSPDHRLGGEGARMLECVEKRAREQGCSILTATVCPAAGGATEALKAMLKVGFRLSASAPNLIAIQKEI